MRVYRTKELTNDRQRIYFKARCEGATPIEAMKVAGYPHPETNYPKIENAKRMQYMLRKHMPKYINVVTPEWKTTRLKHIVEKTIPLVDDEPSDYATGIKAIAELNKMQGHYAPTQNQNMNLNVNADADDVKAITERLDKLDRYKKDY